MELKEFISDTLTQIATGVNDAIKKSKGNDYLVNPSTEKVGATYTIHFDLSVQSHKEGKAGIKVIDGAVSHHADNRISFDINMTLPTSGNTETLEEPEENL